VTCECTRDSNFGCREFTCFEAGSLGSGRGDFFFPICVVNEGHADVCASDADCQAGDYCVDGRCRIDDRAGCDICTTCTTSADCGGRGVCIGTNNGSQPGVCATACDDGEKCPGNATCRTVTLQNGRRTQDVQACLDGDVPDFDGATAQDYCEGFVCEVACRDDVPCPNAADVCTDGVCGPPPAEGEGEDDGIDPAAIELGGGGPRCSGCSAGGADMGLFVGLCALALGRRRRR
jgi:hypothetical protein